ncbi:MAG: hypothetical protein MJK14_19890, partial [Rivularia sp. ALOHA_DT_140]|nr:hypothetical protein [Rivularia sp. ALOHA_DT_140]
FTYRLLTRFFWVPQHLSASAPLQFLRCLLFSLTSVPFVHNQRPGDGITKDIYYKALEPLGFDIKLYPHSHNLGAEVIAGQNGRNSWRLRLSQRLSGIDPDTPEAAQSIMCVAQRIK